MENTLYIKLMKFFEKYLPFFPALNITRARFFTTANDLVRVALLFLFFC